MFVGKAITNFKKPYQIGTLKIVAMQKKERTEILAIKNVFKSSLV